MSDDPKNPEGTPERSSEPAQWRQTDDGMWQYRAEDGYWYQGEGPNPHPPLEPQADGRLLPPPPAVPMADGAASSLLPPPPVPGPPTIPSGAPPEAGTTRAWQGPKKWWIAGIALIVLAGAGIGIGVGTSGGSHHAAATAASTTPATSPPPVDTTTTTTAPVPIDTDLPVGTPASITKNGQPYYSVTMTQFVNPAQAADSYFELQNPGDTLVAAAFTVTNQSTDPLSDDINLDAKIYNSAGQGFEPNFEQTASGPSFPSGEIDVAPGGTASGWVMFEVPGSTPLTTVDFTPSAGYATQATVSWSVG